MTDKQTQALQPPKFPQVMVGWVETIALPELGVEALEAKIDTGAKTSCLHAEDITPFEKDGETWVSFITHPKRASREVELKCEAKVLDTREITSSNGTTSTRYVIETWVHVGPYRWPIDVSLTSRKSMKYRMLFGRSSLGKNCLVSPTFSHLTGCPQLENFTTLHTERYQLDNTHV